MVHMIVYIVILTTLIFAGGLYPNNIIQNISVIRKLVNDSCNGIVANGTFINETIINGTSEIGNQTHKGTVGMAEVKIVEIFNVLHQKQNQAKSSEKQTGDSHEPVALPNAPKRKCYYAKFYDYIKNKLSNCSGLCRVNLVMFILIVILAVILIVNGIRLANYHCSRTHSSSSGKSDSYQVKVFSNGKLINLKTIQTV